MKINFKEEAERLQFAIGAAIILTLCGAAFALMHVLSKA